MAVVEELPVGVEGELVQHSGSAEPHRSKQLQGPLFSGKSLIIHTGFLSGGVFAPPWIC